MERISLRKPSSTWSEIPILQLPKDLCNLNPISTREMLITSALSLIQTSPEVHSRILLPTSQHQSQLNLPSKRKVMLTTLAYSSIPTSLEVLSRISLPTSQHQSQSNLPKREMLITSAPSSTPTSPEELSRTLSPTSQHQLL